MIDSKPTARKPISQLQDPSRTRAQAIRDEAPNLQAKAVEYEVLDAGAASGDTTLLEAGGLAAALVSYGQRVSSVPAR